MFRQIGLDLKDWKPVDCAAKVGLLKGLVPNIAQLILVSVSAGWEQTSRQRNYLSSISESWHGLCCLKHLAHLCV